MLNLLVGIVIGLFVGWNFFPQPAIVKNWWEKLISAYAPAKNKDDE